MKEYKINIITYPRIEDGKGRFLQAYALYTAIKKLGYKPEIINYYPEEWISHRTILNKIIQFFHNPNFFGYVRTMKHKIAEVIEKKSIAISKSKYCNFIKNNIEYDFSHIITKNELKKITCDAWICGSDQIWNTYFSVGVDSAYYLQFAPKKHRISYAASMGTLDINTDLIEKQMTWISEIDHISVREEETKKLLQEKFDINSEQVCDPTFLMSREWWDDLGSKRIIAEHYLLLFLFDSNPLPRKMAERIAKEKNLKIVCISDNYKDSLKYIVPFGIGPEEFVSLFKYADFVCTQSFHGTVLSVIFNRQFLAFDRSEEGDINGLILRIRDLLNQLGLEKRIISSSDNTEFVTEIDFTKVNEIIAEKRNKGMEYLSRSLSEAVND